MPTPPSNYRSTSTEPNEEPDEKPSGDLTTDRLHHFVCPKCGTKFVEDEQTEEIKPDDESGDDDQAVPTP